VGVHAFLCVHLLVFCVIGMHMTVYDCMHALECGMLACMIDVRATSLDVDYTESDDCSSLQ